MAALQIESLCKRHGDVDILKNVSLEVRDGEFLTLLGPSGCGKSTTLFSIAGLETPTSGRITLGAVRLFDRDENIELAPEARNCGLVFQSYALWPHMTVRENVAYPLRLRGVRRAVLDQKVDDALGLVEMLSLAQRYPHELSGGQQQRVALARTLVYEPTLLLLDEPLSNLDSTLRLRARGWLRELQRRLRITTVYVTHDQDEALSLSDRIAVMSAGRIVQIGTPRDIYQAPRNPFVADFVGHSNLLSCTVESVGVAGDRTVRLADGQLLRAETGTVAQGSAAQIAIRADHVEIVDTNDALPNVIRGNVLQRDFLGTHMEYLVAIGGAEVRVRAAREIQADRVWLHLPQDRCMLFDAPAVPA
ncbi:ABC transporter ATP-binding protein [Pandoraea sp. PE-S2R-1]|uniref:ABC transporter ATP-binding protein n=1 Tax=Pandoraea sp. PE-S2R-1 TaxID=1986994 RepID=UPI000B403885|nr:ABC transporter ATP-binding protein [Pandoraea sp. PE-S2R-1]